MKSQLRDGGIGNIEEKLNITNASVFLLIGILNTITGISTGKPVIGYTYNVVPFFIFVFFAIKFGNIKTNAYFFAFIGILVTFLGVEDNATGAIFLIFSFYIFHNLKSNIIVISLTLIAIVCKFMFLEFTISQAVNMILAYVYIFLIYYILIHPKKDNKITVICQELDTITVNILQKLYLGCSVKEISDMIYLTNDAVSKRIGRARVTMNARNTNHLLAICQDKGYISLKLDK